MKHRKRKEGFTLIELLVTIGILSIIVIIVGVIVFSNIGNSKEKSTKITMNSIKEIAIAYALEESENIMWDDESNGVSDEDKEFTCTTIQHLINKGYLKNNLVNAENGKKIDSKQFIKITKDEYSVMTSSIDSSEISSCDNKEIDFNIIIEGLYKDFDVQNERWYYDGTDEKVKTTLVVNAADSSRIKDYSFNIKLADENIRVSKDNINNDGNKFYIELSDKLTDSIKNNGKDIEVCGNISNRNDLSSNKCENVNVDFVKPTCTIDGESTTWTNSNRTISWVCNDAQSGCEPLYDGSSKSFTATTKTSQIDSYTIKDKVGNATTCNSKEINVYVDKTPPTCTDRGDSEEWTNSNRTIYWECEDIDSECDPDHNGSSKTFTTTTKTSQIDSYTIKDKAGNIIECPSRTADVYVDKAKPTTPTLSLSLNNGYVITANSSTDNYTATGEIKYYLTVNGTTYNGTNGAVNTLASSYRTSTSGITISAYSEDKAGNKSDVISKTFVVKDAQTETPTGNTTYVCSITGAQYDDYWTAYNNCVGTDQGTFTERYYCNGYQSNSIYCAYYNQVVGYRFVNYQCTYGANSYLTWHEYNWSSTNIGCPSGYQMNSGENSCSVGIIGDLCYNFGETNYLQLECYNDCISIYPNAEVVYYCNEDGNEYTSPNWCTYNYNKKPDEIITFYCPLTGNSSTNQTNIYEQCTNYCPSGTTYYLSGCYSFN